MSLFAILSTSRHSLAAHRARTAVAGNNIANVNTEGFSRRRVSLADMPEYMVMGARVGAGVIADRVSRMRDTFLEQEVTTTYGRAGNARAEHGALIRFRALDVDAPHHVQAALDRFFNGMRGVLADPESVSVRSAAVADAESLAYAVRTTAAATEEARSAIDGDMGGNVIEANALASEVAALNRDIFTQRAGGTEPNDLLDQRDLAAGRLAELTGATLVPDEDGNQNLMIDGQHALVVGDKFASLQTEVDATNRGHLQLQLVSTDGMRTLDLSSDDISGELGGLLSARDVTLRDISDGLDTFAIDFSAAMNAEHQGGFGLSGQTGNDLFDATGTPIGAAGRFAVGAAVAADPSALAASDDATSGPGNNQNLLSLLALEDSPLASGAAPHSVLSRIASSYAAQTNRAEVSMMQEGALKDRLDAMRAETSGVSVDEEMITLTEAQRAFEAVGKVIQTTDQLLEAVVRLK